MGWINPVQDMGKWRAFVNTTIHVQVPNNMGKFLNWLNICLDLRQDWFVELYAVLYAMYILQGGSYMTGTNYDLFTHNQSRSNLNYLVYTVE